MSEAFATIGIAALTGCCACVVWAVRVLWQLDRRIVRLEVKAGFNPSEGVP